MSHSTVIFEIIQTVYVLCGLLLYVYNIFSLEKVMMHYISSWVWADDIIAQP